MRMEGLQIEFPKMLEDKELTMTNFITSSSELQARHVT